MILSHHKDVNLILGPPGSGKTTKLLSLIEQELVSGVQFNKICFLSFTVNAAQEAITRVCKKFDLQVSKRNNPLPWFRTIHSLCYRQLGILHTQLIKIKDQAEVAKAVYLPRPRDNGAGFGSMNYTSRLFHLENLSRSRDWSLQDTWLENSEEIAWNDLNNIQETLLRYKQAYMMYDFTDLLQEFLYLPDNELPEFDVLFIDEAQDLSKLQWKVIDRIATKTKKIYIAGDDDQAIHTWAGADIETFLHLKATNTQVLDQSYRIPRKVHEFATQVIKRIENRYVKEFKPRDEEGEITFHKDLDSVHLTETKKESWLILARNNYQLENVREHYLDAGIDIDKPKSNIRASTIHSAKGSEADNVVLITDISKRTSESIHKFLDNEIRTFYVGITRARKTLHIVSPTSKYGFNLLMA